MPYSEDNGVEEVRIFKEKLALFLADLRSGRYFKGRKLAYIVHVIEFQWRKTDVKTHCMLSVDVYYVCVGGNPHAHIVYRLTGPPLTPDEVNVFFCTSFSQTKTEADKKCIRLHMIHTCKPGLCLLDGKPCNRFYPNNKAVY